MIRTLIFAYNLYSTIQQSSRDTVVCLLYTLHRHLLGPVHSHFITLTLHYPYYIILFQINEALHKSGSNTCVNYGRGSRKNLQV